MVIFFQILPLRQREMKSRLIRQRTNTDCSTTTYSASLPWISPLRYRKPTSATPDPPPPSPSNSPSGLYRRYIQHADAIHMINREPDPQRALDIFNLAGSQPGFNHNHSTYSAILDRLARSRKFLAVDALLRRMVHEPCRFHEGLLLNLMSHFSKSRILPPEKTLELFHSIPTLVRAKPSLKAFSTCLNLLVESGRFDLGLRLLTDAKRRYLLVPNTCIYNILVKHYCKRKDLDSAFGMLEVMRRTDSSSASPNLITYSTIIGGLCDEGRLKNAFKLFEEMMERDRIVPDALTYNVLINGFCRKGMVDKARQILGFMRRNGCDPNVVNYSALMCGYCKEGRLEDARELFDEMRMANIEADAVSYTTLISCFCKMGRTDEGIKLVKEMGCKGCRPDVITFNAVIGGLCNEKRLREAMRLLENLPHEGVRLNKASYRIVMNHLCREREVDKAVDLLGLMLRRGILPHHCATNDLLVGLCEAGKVVDAAMALHGLAEAGVRPEISTWVQLVGAVSRERKLAGAFQLLDQLVMKE